VRDIVLALDFFRNFLSIHLLHFIRIDSQSASQSAHLSKQEQLNSLSLPDRIYDVMKLAISFGK